MIRLSVLLLLCLLGSGLAAPAHGDDQAGSTKTNVVLILIDDLGWKDLGCYGSDYYQTPNIDRLAAEGMRFTDAYSSCNVCSPSRAAILTGKYPARLLLTQWLPSGRWDAAKNQLREGRYLSNLPLEEITLAEAFETGVTSLYDLSSDLGETNDLSAAMPEKTSELQKHLHRWQQDVGADPMRPNPQFQP